MAPTLCLNAGSSSLKFALFDPKGSRDADGLPEALLRGEIDVRGHEATAVFTRAGEAPVALRSPDVPVGDVAVRTRWLLERLERDHAGLGKPSLIVHRIVHGGTRYVRSIPVTPNVISDLEALGDLAPLHQKPGLEGVRAAAAALPNARAFVCFDTAFHTGHAESESRYALPTEWYERGYRRYGFHGLSYESVARRLPALLGERAQGAVVVAHLGSGASLCGLRRLRSVTTTMGLTALDGLVMATRPGTIDPGIVLRWVGHEHLDPQKIEDLLYRRSGLLGVSETSSDIRDLMDRNDPKAALAVEMFVASVVRHTGAVAATLGGLDVLVFTGGIGTHQPAIRTEIVRRLGWLGLAIDPDARPSADRPILSPPNRPPVLVLEAREEEVMALGAWESLA